MSSPGAGTESQKTLSEVSGMELQWERHVRRHRGRHESVRGLQRTTVCVCFSGDVSKQVSVSIGKLKTELHFSVFM